MMDNESWQTPQDWLAEDSTDPGYQLLTDSEIVAEVTRGGDSLDPESDDEVEPQPTVSHAQAFDAFETALKWLEGQSDTDPFHLLLVRKWRDIYCCPEKSADLETNHSSFLFSLTRLINVSLYHTCICFYALCTCDQCFYIAMYIVHE